MNDEADQVAKAREGDRLAFDALGVAYRPRIEKFAAMMAGDEDPEEIAQEVLALAFDRIRGFRGDSKFSTWILGMALNVCRSRRRARKERPVDPAELGESPQRRRSVLSSIIRLELADHLARAVDGLPDSMREAFVLRYIEELDYPEIAAVLEIPEGTVRVRAHRARALLKETLGSSFDSMFQSR